MTAAQSDSDAHVATIVTRNLAQVRDRVAQAASACGRERDSITIIGVTKYVDVPITRMLATAGCLDLGESRPQQLQRKAEQITDAPRPRWHLIGHLQRNKVKKVIPYASLIHSVDSMRLAATLDQLAGERNQTLDVLLEVNISGDVAKHGFASHEVEGALEQIASLSRLRVRGLMTMAALQGGATTARQNFADLRELRDQLRTNCPDNVRLDELSMGMSGDFEEAILEGSTMVRVGSALFKGLQI